MKERHSEGEDWHADTVSQGLNLVAQIVKILGGTISLRSKQGVGTTVKVAIPLHCPPSTPPREDSPIQLQPPSLQTSVGFIGFGSLGRDASRNKVRSEGSERLMNSLKRTCKQLGMPVVATSEAFESNASVYVVREQEEPPGHFSMTRDSNLRRSLLATKKPLIFVCASRESTFRLQSMVAPLSLVTNTQYLWPPIGPAKLLGAISACRMFFPLHYICAPEVT